MAEASTKNDLWSYVLGAPGAFSIVSFAHDSIHWQDDLQSWIDEWRVVTHSFTNVIFGWIPILFNVTVPGWASDYLAMGIIVGAAQLRENLPIYLLIKDEMIEAAISAEIMKQGGDPALAKFLRILMLPIFSLLVAYRITLSGLFWPINITKTVYQYVNTLYRPDLYFLYPVYPKNTYKLPKYMLNVIHRGLATIDRRAYLEASKRYFSSFLIALILIAVNFALTHAQ